jgi:pyruvyltransferase
LFDVKKRLKKVFRKSPTIHAFWWKEKKNFGDLLTPELVFKYGGIANWVPASDTKLVGVGSLMHLIPQQFSGIFLGTGLIRDQKLEFPHASFAAVRGELTKTNLGINKDTPTGDLGLLADRLISAAELSPQYEIALVPHFVDFNHPWVDFIRKHCQTSVNIIDVRNSAEFVSKEISKCRRVYSSSLHGLIVADSLGLPNVWIELSNKVIGDGFKFHDYNSSIDFTQYPVQVKPNMLPTEVDKGIAFKSRTTILKKKEELNLILGVIVNGSQ